MTELELTREIVKVLDNKKAIDIKAIGITEQTIVADYFVIASGTSNTHVNALRDAVDFKLSSNGVEPHHVEGHTGAWVLMDYGSVVIHIFTDEGRNFYQLDRVWADAISMPVDEILG